MPPSVPQTLGLLKSAPTPKPSSSTAPPTPRSTSKQPAPQTPTQRNLSSFAPFDHDQLVGRLGSFKAVFWGQLPEELCELEWARRGWVERRDGVKGVECGLCHGSVEVIWDWNRLREKRLEEKNGENGVGENAGNGVEGHGVEEGSLEGHGVSGTEEMVQTNSDGDLFATEATDDDHATSLLLKYYTPLLSSGHKHKCPWASRTADTTVLRLPPSILSLANLQSRLPALTEILSSFPSASQLILPKPLPPTLPATLADYDPRTIQAAVAGWVGQPLGKRGLLTCGTCHRRVGLWTFTNDEVLDLLAEHKRYCPWINAGVQGGMAGWEYLFALLQPKSALGKRGREDEGQGDVKENRIKKLRDMLKSLKK
jgi:C3HC zinc finger-like/Rsm1-like